MINPPTPAPTARAQEILALARQAQQGADEVRELLGRSVGLAMRCGKLLLEEKAEITHKMGRGYWESYFDITFGKLLHVRQARRWMVMARDEADKLSGDFVINQPNALRDGMLALDLFPPKEHVATEDAGKLAHMPALKTANHLAIINRFTAWQATLLEENGEELTDEQCAQLAKDFAPVIAFMDRLRMHARTS